MLSARRKLNSYKGVVSCLCCMWLLLVVTVVCMYTSTLDTGAVCVLSDSDVSLLLFYFDIYPFMSKKPNVFNRVELL